MELYHILRLPTCVNLISFLFFFFLFFWETVWTSFQYNLRERERTLSGWPPRVPTNSRAFTNTLNLSLSLSVRQKLSLYLWSPEDNSNSNSNSKLKPKNKNKKLKSQPLSYSHAKLSSFPSTLHHCIHFLTMASTSTTASFSGLSLCRTNCGSNNINTLLAHPPRLSLTLTSKSKSAKPFNSLQLNRNAAFPNGFRRFRSPRTLVVRCDASSGTGRVTFLFFFKQWDYMFMFFC